MNTYVIDDFDRLWYLDEYKDVKEIGIDPYIHYLNDGKREGRYPNKNAKDPKYASYSEWLAFDTLTENDRFKIKKDLARLKKRPLISIIMPVYNTRIDWLREAIESVQGQLYQNWELCIADDFSPDGQIRIVLKDYEEKDKRIKVIFRSENGNISENTNSAINIASGEWLAFMDHDDIIEPHALYMAVKKINDNDWPLKLIYTDEDKINHLGERFEPYFKSDWDPVLFLQQNFVAHMSFFESQIVKQLGGVRKGYEGSQDYDLTLRVVSKISECEIAHIPMVLYHWRKCEDHNSFSTKYQEISDQSAYKSLMEHLAVNGNYEIIKKSNSVGMWDIRQKQINNQFVSIIIPSRDNVNILHGCIDSIIKLTSYMDFEILIIDNGSVEKETKIYYRSLENESRIRVLYKNIPFNYSTLNNFGVENAKGDVFIFLNNDTVILVADWIQKLLSFFSDTTVGIVGAKLLYNDNTIQHAGVTLGIYGIAGHTLKLLKSDSDCHFNYLQLARCVSAVTGACLAIKKTIFNEINGFDEKLSVSYNDVDLCVKVRKSGYKIVYNPNVTLYHYESKSRGADDSPVKKRQHAEESLYLINKHGTFLMNDPYYNPNLTIQTEEFTITNTPRYQKPWSDVIELLIPFHRGDIVIAIQVATIAIQYGKKIRLHVCQNYFDFVSKLAPSLNINSIPVSIPPAQGIPKGFTDCANYVKKMNDFSGMLVTVHNGIDWKSKGLSIHSALLYQMGIPLDAKGSPQLVEAICPDFLQSLDLSKWLLLFPKAGWELKSMPNSTITFISFQAKKLGFEVVQLGGPNDEKIQCADIHFLGDYSPGVWRYIFEKSAGLITADSWPSHFAAALNIHYCVIYNSTSPVTINSDSLYIGKTNNAFNIGPYATCSPCDSFECKVNNSTVCDTYNSSSDKMYFEISYFLAGIRSKLYSETFARSLLKKHKNEIIKQGKSSELGH